MFRAESCESGHCGRDCTVLASDASRSEINLPVANKPTDTTREPAKESRHDDTALHSLSRTDRKKLNMDSWEPSLLRELLRAQNRLKNSE